MERIIIDGLSFSLPLFIMAVGGIYSEKSGITNLALEGIQGMGISESGIHPLSFMRQSSLPSSGERCIPCCMPCFASG